MQLNHTVGALTSAGLAVLAGAALAQSDPASKLERIEVTGSSIKRVQDEGALPVQTLKASDLAKLGVTTAEQLLQQISANGNGIDNLATNQGGDFTTATSGTRAHNNGSSAASLRGLGAQYTLVLLNGRRLSTHGLNGQSVDLNGIPLAALDRVEVLKDGASAVYGTDAIGGVINFVLKKDYQGLEATVAADATQHGGGNILRGSVLFGAGSLQADGFNVMTALTYDVTGRLRGTQRSFHNGIQPDKGLFPDTTGTPFANIGSGADSALAGSFTLPGDSTVINRLNLLNLQGECDSVADMYAYRGDVTGSTAFNRACSYDYGKRWSLMQPVANTNFVGRGSLALTKDATGFVEVVASRSKSTVEYAEIQLTGSKYQYPAGGEYYQDLAALAPSYFKLTDADPTDNRVFFDASKPEIIRWRCLPCGPRQQVTTTDAARVLAGVEGVFADWDYTAALSAAQSKANTVYGSGNMFTDKLVEAMSTGKINPFLAAGETQTAEAMALIDAASARGYSLYGGKANVIQVGGVASKEVVKLPSGNAAVAVGFDLRRETYRFTNGQLDAPAVNGVSSAPSLERVARSIKAVYAELEVPLAKHLDLQLAARHDRYNDFGGTTNPKVALRWQPTKHVLLRGSFNKGFHAPDFDSLYGGDTSSQFNSDINDPLLCPTGAESTGCGIRPEITTRANPNLKPETSKQYSLGLAVSPVVGLTVGVDYWNIKINNRIGALSGLALINDYERYGQYVVRDAATNEITQVVAPYFNLAGDKTNGVDLTLNFTTDSAWGRWSTSLSGTYINSYKSRLSPADAWVERVNDFGGPEFGYDLKLRWKHTAAITWTLGPWSSTFQQVFNSGYNEEVGGYSGFTPPQLQSKVASYTLYNLTASYSGFKHVTLTAGIKNLFDTKPPFSGHNVDNVAGAGWDARVGDPRLRSLLLRASYKFW